MELLYLSEALFCNDRRIFFKEKHYFWLMISQLGLNLLHSSFVSYSNEQNLHFAFKYHTHLFP